MSKALHKKNIEKAQKAIINEKKKYRPTMRQKYHFMAETGWLNDPNGLIFYRGKYHFFYQHNPYAPFWGTMHWGHAISDDLLHWEYLPVALAPSEEYDDAIDGGCFSGSAIEWDNKLYLFYTGRAKTEQGYVQVQCMAWSEDGINFEKYENNPIITAPQGIDQDNFRDPKIWRKEDMFYLLCGAKKENTAQALLYSSKDLKNWEYVNVMFESRGEYGYMFECPDFFHLNDMSIFTFSPMGLGERTAMYIVGHLDYKTGKFESIRTGEIDWGFDYYAAQSFLDATGRRIMVSWSNGWEWMPWWKDWGPTYKEGWSGFFNIPREVTLLPDNALQFKPIRELNRIAHSENTKYEIEIANKTSFQLSQCIAGRIKLILDLEKTTAQTIEIVLRSDMQEESLICLNLRLGEITFDRNKADGWSTGVTKSTFILKDKTELDIDILIDKSSVELFCDNYRNNHSCNIFANNLQVNNYIKAINGNIVMKSIYTCTY